MGERGRHTDPEWLECDVPAEVPVLFLKSTVLFPLQVVSIQIASRPNRTLLDQHRGPEEIVAAGLLLDPDGPYARRNVSPAAVACRVISRLHMADGTTKVVLQGLRRIRLAEILASRPYLRARAECVDEPVRDTSEVRALVAQVLRLVRQLVEVDERYPDELRKVVRLNMQSGARCADFVADQVQLSYADKRRVLETEDVTARLTFVADRLRRLIARARVANEVQAKTAVTIGRAQREELLRAQMEVIRRELGELDPAEEEIAALETRLHAAEVPAAVLEQALREVQRLREPAVRALEGSAIRAYVEWVPTLPWTRETKDRLDLRRARRLLRERTFGFEEAKRRFLEFLAVRKLGGSPRASLLAIAGPPGTGRTSLARAIADILGRAFVRIPLRGVHDETEFRGVRRGDVGARPSRVLEALREAGTRNPVLLLDGLDQLEAGAGDPLAAVVEALDPLRRHRFLDPYLGVPFDLSRVLFLVTVQVEEYLPDSLWEDFTVLQLPGYTEQEKQTIARRFLWPAVLREHGLSGRRVTLTRAALREIIRHYTREAGVKGLRARLERVCRRLAMEIAAGKADSLSVSSRNLRDLLGAPPYADDERGKEPLVGTAIGLAWTEEGGDLLPVEALLMPGEGRRTLTGLLGEVMQESVAAAISYVRSRADALGIAPDLLEKNDLHVHFPEAAIAKDGPSAGIAVAVAIASLFSGRPVRPGMAMTGEISLRGQVLAVGSVREKVLAAYRAGLRHVILPQGNESDLSDVPRELRAKMRFHLVRDVDEAFGIALARSRKRRRG